MKGKIRNFLIISILIFSVVFFAGCRSQFFMSRIECDYNITYNFTLQLCALEEEILNASAAANGISQLANQELPWTIEDYLFALASFVDIEFVSMRTKEDNPAVNGFRNLEFRKVIDISTYPVEADGSIRSFVQSITQNSTLQRVNRFSLFVHRYRQTMPNPFVAYYAQYQNPPSRSLFCIFRNGHEQLPSFFEAFPFASSTAFNINNFTVNFVIRSNNRYTVFGDDFMYVDRNTGNRYYVFTARFDGNFDYIIFEFIRPNPLGWYLLAILLGITAIVIILIISKFKLKTLDKRNENC